MATNEERLDDLESEVTTIKNVVARNGERIDRLLNGEKDLGAKGLLQRLEKMEQVYEQYEGLTKIFDWIEKLVKYGLWASPFIGTALLWLYHNLSSTDQLLGK